MFVVEILDLFRGSSGDCTFYEGAGYLQSVYSQLDLKFYRNMMVSTPVQSVSFATTLGLGMQICPTFPTRQPYPLGRYQKYCNVT